MSGHSKWSQIKRQKGVADKKKGNLFTKLGNAITIAARESGGSPETNFKLRLAIEKAKMANMPNDNIDRAVQRGTGELAGETLQEMSFEGYGPSGVALIIQALSSNRNKATSIIRSILTKYGGKLGESGSVNWLFIRKGVIGVAADKNREELELKAIDTGAEDIAEEKEGLAIYTKPDDLQTIKEKLEQAGLKIDYAAIEMVPENKITLPEKDKNNFQKLIEELEDNDEISEIYSNAVI